MQGPFMLLILLGVACLVSGPIALIISIIALNKTKEMYRQLLLRKVEKPRREEKVARPVISEKPIEVTKEERPAETVRAAEIEEPKKISQDLLKAAAERIKEKEKGVAGRETISLEQRIGTRWILIAGIITVIFAAGFFLKYAYDTNLIGPLGRVVIVAILGLVALAIGEITRKRGYGIVAKGVTALGFAILYAAVFSAYRFYGLIGSTPAFAISILVTTAAMLYAVSMNEIVVAFLSLLGGFLTPAIVSTGENLPTPLFIYVLILGLGAMLCAYYRKWRAINILAFAGTFLLYIGWFEKFYRPTIRSAEGIPEQMAIALAWLTIFFTIYLVLPLLHELIKKVKAKEEDILLVLANSAVVFYYLWIILFEKYRTALAFCALALCAAHLVMMTVVTRRNKDDLNLRLALLVIGLFFLTIAVPLYLKMYAIAMAWAAEGIILAVIGLRYRSHWTQAGGAIALLLSFGQLLRQLPMHTGAFNLVFNPAFGTWCFVAGSLLVCHIIYRTTSELPEDQRGPITQVLYAATTLLLMAAITMEWYWHCDYNIANSAIGNNHFLKGMVIIFTGFPLLLLVRPICPKGILCRILAMILAGAGAIFTMLVFSEFYSRYFVIFANLEFGIVLVFVAALFASGWLLSNESEESKYNQIFATAFVLAGIFVLWVLLTKEIYLYWYWHNRLAEKTPNWRFLSHMYISVMWAVYGAALMTVGFWRKKKILRYIAIGLFALLLVKVFILDTKTVKSVYRIAAFLATGVTLVGVSYLYQFLRKKGFFETILDEENVDR
ncbi:MAG: DUF2339 domain-containing protein [Planctomycetes bacterium]|nr:DUF2339 domain-containing protein [Planctomycetota bacterium]